MPAGALGVTLYLARLAGASWPRSEGGWLGCRGERGGGGSGKASAAGRREGKRWARRARARAGAPKRAIGVWPVGEGWATAAARLRAGASKPAIGVSMPAG